MPQLLETMPPLSCYVPITLWKADEGYLFLRTPTYDTPTTMHEWESLMLTRARDLATSSENDGWQVYTYTWSECTPAGPVPIPQRLLFNGRIFKRLKDAQSAWYDTDPGRNSRACYAKVKRDDAGALQIERIK